jgi:hypothetical protein
LGGSDGILPRTGLWIYDLTKGEAVKVLRGHVSGASWSRDRTRLLIHLSQPYWETWVADLDPNLPTAESLKPVQTLQEYCLEAIAMCTRDLEADPESFINQWTRATAALWIRDPNAVHYVNELDLRLGRPPIRRAVDNVGLAQIILAHPALSERLGDLAWVLARRAVEQQPDRTKDLAVLLERAGQHEHADQLLQMAQAATLRGSCRWESGTDSYTVVGGGADIVGPQDELHFAYKALTGNGSITAKIASMEDVHPQTEAGVMMRTSLDSGSPVAAAYATAGSGVRFCTRVLPNRNATVGDPITTPEQTAVRAPIWVKLERKENQFSASYSCDGENWTQMVGGPRKISMPNTVWIGLAITSHDSRKTAAARLSHVTVIGKIIDTMPFDASQDIRLPVSPAPYTDVSSK